MTKWLLLFIAFPAFAQTSVTFTADVVPDATHCGIKVSTAARQYFPVQQGRNACGQEAAVCVVTASGIPLNSSRTVSFTSAAFAGTEKTRESTPVKAKVYAWRTAEGVLKARVTFTSLCEQPAEGGPWKCVQE